MPCYQCPKHGKVRIVGGEKDPKFCPVCGSHVTRVFWIPNIYVDTKIVKALSISGIIAAFLYCLIPTLIIPGVNGCNESDRREEKVKQDKIDSMRPAWHNLYIQLCNSMFSDPQMEAIKSFIEVGKLNNLPILTPFELEMIMSMVNVSNKSKVSSLLAPYCIEKSTTQQARNDP